MRVRKILVILTWALLLSGAVIQGSCVSTTASESTVPQARPLSFINIGQTYTFVIASGSEINPAMRYKVVAVSEDGWLQVTKEGKNNPWWLNSAQVTMLQ
jgi:hypothetical protein